jgi:hypothetical protein
MSQKIYLSLTEGLILKAGCWPRKAFINEQQRNRTTRTQAKPKQPDAAPGLTNPPFPSWSYQRPAGAWRIIWPPLRTIGKGSSQERKGGEGESGREGGGWEKKGRSRGREELVSRGIDGSCDQIEAARSLAGCPPNPIRRPRG